MIKRNNLGSYIHNRSSLVRHEFSFICPSCDGTYTVSTYTVSSLR